MTLILLVNIHSHYKTKILVVKPEIIDLEAELVYLLILKNLA